MKTLIPPYSLAYKKRVYSPARIRYPMMRVDFDPDGERNPQNRGVSKFKRISWDKALDIITSEMNRIKDKYGPTSLLYQCDQHGENKVVQACHGAGRKLLRAWGGFTLQMRQPDSWEGWWWGSKHFWGCEPVGQGQQSNLLYDIAKNAELLLFWGCDQETTPWGWQGQLPSRLSYWWSEIGIKQIYVCPDLNYAAAVHADRWIPVLPNTDAAMYLGICYQWFKDGTYDKDYLATHAVGVDKFEAYVTGEEDGVKKTPEWAAEDLRRPRPHHQGPGQGMGEQAHHRGHRQRRPRHPRPLRHRAGPPAVHLPRHAGPGQTGRQPGQDDRVGLCSTSPTSTPSRCRCACPTCAAPIRAAIPTRPTTRRSSPRPSCPRAILEGECDWWGCESETAERSNQFVHYKYPADGCSKIHMVWTDYAELDHLLERRQRLRQGHAAPRHRVHVRPAPVAGERLPDGRHHPPREHQARRGRHRRRHLQRPVQRCSIPSTSASSPSARATATTRSPCMIAERLGLKEEYTGGKTIPELIRHGYETSRCDDLITWEELNEKGYYVVPTAEGWEDVPAGFYNFYKDPEKYPLSTPTGKLEFEASGLAWSTSPTTSSGRRSPSGSPRASATRRPSAPRVPRSIRCS